ARAMEQFADKTRTLGGWLGERVIEPVDGVYFVSLAGVASADLLPATLASCLGLIFREGEDPQAQLLAYLQDKQLWLVLDNFEHLTDGTALLLAMLDAPRVRLLVTSRHPLNVRAEWQFPLDGLSYPSPAETGAEPLSHSAVQLFMQAT